MQKVGDNPIMKFTGIAAGGDDPAAVQQKNLTVGDCGCSDRQFFYASAGKSFAKELRCSHHGNDIAVAEKIILGNLDFAA